MAHEACSAQEGLWYEAMRGGAASDTQGRSLCRCSSARRALSFDGLDSVAPASLCFHWAADLELGDCVLHRVVSLEGHQRDGLARGAVLLQSCYESWRIGVDHADGETAVRVALRAAARAQGVLGARRAVCVTTDRVHGAAERAPAADVEELLETRVGQWVPLWAAASKLEEERQVLRGEQLGQPAAAAMAGGARDHERHGRGWGRDENPKYQKQTCGFAAKRRRE